MTHPTATMPGSASIQLAAKTPTTEMSKGIDGDFFGEGGPNGADYANFGILRSMQGLNGFDIVESHHVVSGWYSRMQEHSGVY